MMAMAQLLNVRMPGSYEVTFPPQTPEMPGVEGPGKGPGQSGNHSDQSACLDRPVVNKIGVKDGGWVCCFAPYDTSSFLLLCQFA